MDKYRVFLDSGHENSDKHISNIIKTSLELENWKEQVENEINAKIQSEFFQLMKQINEDNQEQFSSIETKLVEANVENQAMKTEIKTLKKGKLNST